LARAFVKTFPSESGTTFGMQKRERTRLPSVMTGSAVFVVVVVAAGSEGAETLTVALSNATGGDAGRQRRRDDADDQRQ